MKATILDQKTEGPATCFLCRVSLLEYIKSVPEDYQSYVVQRGIVSNQYLDHIVETIHDKKHIPPIVLVCSDHLIDSGQLVFEDYRILDGLQRTHRLKMIFDSVNLLKRSQINPDEKSDQDRFLKLHSKEIRELGSNRQVIRKLMNYGIGPETEYSDFFEGNSLWLEVWVNLSEDDQVNKMLLLNAGHKTVSIKHQLELIFLSTYIELEEIAPPEITFRREKEISAIQYSKNRRLGEYHFSHFISGIIAIAAGKIVNTNSDFIDKLQSESIGKIELYDVLTTSFLKTFLSFLYNLDKELYSDYGETGTRWLGREVVLVGLFGGIGAYAQRENIPTQRLLENELNQLPAKLSKELHLNDYEKARNSVELNKVNVGLSNKKAVYNAVSDLIYNKPFKGWSAYFGGHDE